MFGFSVALYVCVCCVVCVSGGLCVCVVCVCVCCVVCVRGGCVSTVGKSGWSLKSNSSG